MTMNNRPYVLSIAGFDPSAGAGVLADIKTFEANQVYGLGVCTALTFQHESQFDGLSWVPLTEVLRQMEVLYRLYRIEVVKIGLVENITTLAAIVRAIMTYNPNTKIVFDPILKASAGFDFHDAMTLDTLQEVLTQLFLITPNLPELNRLVSQQEDTAVKARLLAQHCAVYLKGGHSEANHANDVLFYQHDSFLFESPRIDKGEKHGSGCVLSSAIAAGLAKGLTLPEACLAAKTYITHFLSSSPTLLGSHF